MLQFVVRRAEASECDAIRTIVQTVVDETYGGIWASPPLPIDEENWSDSTVAVVEDRIVGAVLTRGDWLSDLWVLRLNRGFGIGRALLAQGESEMFARGHRTFRLRVVKFNAAAVGFYLSQGWRIDREFPHERLPISMLEMVKSA